MKTITLTDEMYEFLTDLSQKMKTQDNRSTASPFMYIITEMVERSVGEGCGEERLISPDGAEWDREMFLDDPDEMLNLMNFLVEDEFDEVIDDDIADYLIIKRDYRWVNFSTEREGLHKMRSNVFFTEKAVQAHLKQNPHHYNEGADYVIHGWRNPEMETLHKFLKGISHEKD